MKVALFAILAVVATPALSQNYLTPAICDAQITKVRQAPTLDESHQALVSEETRSCLAQFPDMLARVFPNRPVESTELRDPFFLNRPE